jgi:hypothetical protein
MLTRVVLLGAALALAFPASAAAHGIGGVRDLPVPTSWGSSWPTTERCSCSGPVGSR